MTIEIFFDFYYYYYYYFIGDLPPLSGGFPHPSDHDLILERLSGARTFFLRSLVPSNGMQNRPALLYLRPLDLRIS